MATVATDAARKTNAHKIERKHFTATRELDFFSESELTKQTGHSRDDWPLVIVKELIDNALDACEEAEIAPEIMVAIVDDFICVEDNGPGIPSHVIESLLDFGKRTSSRAAYVAPDRGRQGNALKTIVAMPYVLSGEFGKVFVDTGSVRHKISVSIDPVRQVPQVSHSQYPEKGQGKVGTTIWVKLPSSFTAMVKNDVFANDSPRSHSESKASRFLPMMRAYAMMNPHVCLVVDVEESVVFEHYPSRTCDKWIASRPTDPMWYDVDDLKKLIGANVANDLDNGNIRTVRDFLAEFRGLTSTVKRKHVLSSGDMVKQLAQLISPNEEQNDTYISSLLASMKQQAMPFKPNLLGPIGKVHLSDQFKKLGATPESFKYKQISGTEDGMPWIVEVAFGYRPNMPLRVLTGVNWSPAINNPFRQIGSDQSLDSLLASQRVSEDHPVVFFLHLICPKVRYTDHGKTNIVVGPMDPKLICAAIETVTKDWAKQRKREEKSASAELRRDASMNKTSRVHQIEAGYEVMNDAYMKASSNGTLPANARQIMYCARGPIQEATGEPLEDKYFTQSILPRYMAENQIETADWDVVFDARGHFSEPHTGKTVDIGTLAVRQYLGERPASESKPFDSRCPLWPTNGASNRFGAVLFVEKEGFNPLLERVQIASKFDIAIMSTKGMSTTSARLLIDRVCGGSDIPIFVMHDFDKAGFSILGTLTKTSARYKFENNLRVVDVGLRLSDVEEMQLASESVNLGNSCPDKLRQNLLQNGATEDEADFLLSGRRVELNAMSSIQIVEWLERKLTKNGVKKVIPEKDVLAQAYRRVVGHETIRTQISELQRGADLEAQGAKIPSNIRERVLALLSKNPSMCWDSAIEQIVLSSMN